MIAYRSRKKVYVAMLGCLLTVLLTGTTGCGLDQVMLGGSAALKSFSGFGNAGDTAANVLLKMQSAEDGPRAE